MKRILSFVLALIMVLTLAACGGNDATAASMHLIRTEGTVAVSDGGGKDVALLENLGLYSGYGVNTRASSYAWINLDDVKLTKMDENSEISIQKEGKSLEVEVKSGSLFFNVTEPLADDETLNIRTSTMAVGIRGTCGWVEANDSLSRVYLLEGRVECSAGEQTVQVSAWEMAELRLDGELVVEPFTPENLPFFVRDEVDAGLSGGADETPGVVETEVPETSETPETAAPYEEEQHIGAYKPGSITGTLSLSDFTYDYVEEEGAIEEYEEHGMGNVVGEIILHFTVNGPSEVREVRICGIGPENMYTQEFIEQDIAYALSHWSEYPIYGAKTPPFYGNSSFGVEAEFQGITRDVLLVGLSEDMDIVGYAVVSIDIP